MTSYAHRIEVALDASSLQPAFLKVENIRLLGPTRYWFRSIKHDKTTSVASKKWVVSLYEIPWRKTIVERAQTSDRLLFPDRSLKTDLFPNLKPVVVGTFETERAAMLACEAAWKGRDRTNPVSIANDASEPLPPFWNTHLHITVISDAFHRKSHTERMCMVLEVLLALSDPLLQSSSVQPAALAPETSTTSRHCPLLKFGTVGPQVSRLPHLRHLNCNVVLVLKTTHQFRPVQTVDSLTKLPLTERFGLSHGLASALGIAPVAKTTTKDVKRLVMHPDGDPSSTRLPHFYHGLPAELKAMIAQQQNAQRASIAALDKLSTYVARHFIRPSDPSSDGRSQLQHNSEATVVKKFEKRRVECTRAAIMLQRVYRLYNVVRSMAASFDTSRFKGPSRCYRGYVARVFVHEYSIVVSLASTHIQAVFRSHVSRERTKALRQRMTAAVVHVQRVFRGHQARKLVFWIRFHVASAIQMQRVARGMFGRYRAAMYRRARFKRMVVVPAAKRIQRIYRGHVGRRRFRRIQHDRFVDTIQAPAAMAIQRVARGYLGRQVAMRCRRQLVAALVIQDGFRKFRARSRWAFVWQVRRSIPIEGDSDVA
ncbi:hypothetical protein DYB32_006218 [Aphanomyces invadans]|uniref:Uncharacterized protein n=1 Tax=Aphanomyces invadans TaxID=157072 RepID=A0A418AYS1_9STRA|nr:hypothetical protein DYB32_006218 [Aphanomyces invadans]